MHPTPPQYRPTPTKCCSSFGGQQAKRVASTVGHDSEQQRGSAAAAGDMGCKGQVVDESGEGCGSVSGQEVGAGYVDIPRRVAWERLGGGRRNQALQVGPKHAFHTWLHPHQLMLRAVIPPAACLWDRARMQCQLCDMRPHVVPSAFDCITHPQVWKARGEQMEADGDWRGLGGAGGAGKKIATWLTDTTPALMGLIMRCLFPGGRRGGDGEAQGDMCKSREGPMLLVGLLHAYAALSQSLCIICALCMLCRQPHST